MYSLEDTIAAISTPLGKGGIGIVRMTGPQSLEIARQLFRPADGRPWRRVESRRLYYGHIIAPQVDTAIDEVLLCYMRAPATYTRQDVIEISGHGGLTPLREMLALCLAAGARMAHEGEFTLRAFLNGRIDLAQAEAVLDAINARTEAGLRIAMSQLNGRLSGAVRELRAQLMNALAYLQARIDFPEEDLPNQDILPDLDLAQKTLERMIREAQHGLIYRQGIRTAIIGRPNVGKSSLLNALLRTERAIVTPIPGTTRDTLEEALDLNGIPLVLIDTAGITTSDNIIEQLGIARSRASLDSADLVLLVVDGSAPVAEGDREIAALIHGQATLVLVNKSDLPLIDDYAELLPAAPHLPISALTGAGIPELQAHVLEAILDGQVTATDEPLASNPRHRDAFQRALAHVREARLAWSQGLAAELVAIDVSEAVDALGEITGETASEDLLARIFSNFCIGK